MMSKENLSSPPRERVSVGITGIDRSTPDDLVKDGKCEELHNARYEAEAWRPVHPYMLSKSVPNLPITHKIVYKHPAAPENIYIVESFVNGKYYYYAYDITKPFKEQGAMIPLVKQSEVQMTISHFGNVLMLKGVSGTSYFILVDGKYIASTAPNAPTLSTSLIDEGKTLPDYFRPTENLTVYSQTHAGGSVTFFAHKWYKFDSYGELRNAILYHNQSVSTSPHAIVNPSFVFMWKISNVPTKESLIPAIVPEDVNVRGMAWHGELALFTAYRMADGSIINPSPLSLIYSDNALEGYQFEQEEFFKLRPIKDAEQEDDTKYTAITKEINSDYGNLTIGDIRELSPITYFLPSITLSVDANIDTRNYTEVSVFCTRINPIYDTTYNNAIDGIQELNKVFKDNKLPEQPFYLLKSFPLKNRESDTFSMDLYREELDRVINNLVYTPTIQHTLSGAATLDYNNRLHLANVSTDFRTEALLTAPCDNNGSWADVTPAIGIEVKDKTYYAVGNTLSPTTGDFAPHFQRILSYHDYRAVRYILTIGGYQNVVEMSSSPANNIAYYTKMSPDTKYARLTLGIGTPLEENLPIPAISDQLEEPNRIQVSSPNNPFSQTFDTSYSVGTASNRIIAMQSAAIEMPEMKVGEMPLYVFTTEGIFALIAGQNTLYASVAAINYDKIINPNTLAINGAIVYITEKGVHLLTTQGTQVISTPINDKANRPPLDFLRSCKLIYPKERNEIILHNETLGKGVAYIYNLDAGYWSTRDLKGYKLNTDELYTVNNNIYDLANEDESIGLPMSFVTRPMKLGNIEFKRLETIIPRLATGEHPIEFKMSVEGSVDGSTYMPMRSANVDFEANKVNPITLRRTPFSAKYIKMMFDISPVEENYNPSFSHIDIEWYRKLPHRMR